MVASHLDRIVYLNGEFIRGSEAKLSIFDRGLLFSDAVYEGFGVLDSHIIDIDVHLGRLTRSMAELNLTPPMDSAGFTDVLTALAEKNQMTTGFIYLHITRGEADRDYVYSSLLKANVFAFVQPDESDAAKQAPKGVKMATHPDLRWKRRDIKTSNLLGQVMAKQAADNAGAYEALMIDDQGFVTEGGATSFFIVSSKCIIARPVTNEILHGVTRRAMLAVAERQALTIETRRFTLDEVFSADEAYLTGASSYIQPVIEVDGQSIGNGQPGPVTLSLRAEYLKRVGA